ASTAELCARQGHGVILTYNRHPDAAQAVAQRIEADGGRAVALKLDVANVSTFAAFGEAVAQTLNSTWGVNTLSGLVNNAGYGLFNPL
ncbi:SDR family NAD(P)-dependent oxidoreductase, partial [Klebsiella pneumoniae]